MVIIPSNDERNSQPLNWHYFKMADAMIEGNSKEKTKLFEETFTAESSCKFAETASIEELLKFVEGKNAE